MDTTIIQYIIIAILFCVALVYVFRSVRQSFKGKKTCSKGCDCSVKPFENKT